MNPHTHSPGDPLLYFPQGPGPFPLICQTPLLGRMQFLEDLFFEKKIARYFSRKGFACAILNRPIFEYNPDLDLNQFSAYLETSIERNQTALTRLLTDPRIDAHQIGTFGMSFGAIVNSLWAARDSRLKAHVFALPGADLAEIFTTSRDPLMMSYLHAALAHTKLSAIELARKLRPVFKLDPLHLSGQVDPGNSLVLLSIFDRVIRFSCGLRFKKALGNPQTFYLPLGHYTAILAFPFLRNLAANFFKTKLGAVHACSKA